MSKGVSAFKPCLEYCEDTTRSCEKLNLCFPDHSTD